MNTGLIKKISRKMKIERPLSIKAPAQFINDIRSLITYKGKRHQANKQVIKILQKIKMIDKSSSPVRNIKALFMRGRGRIALNNYVLRGKKILVPNPARRSKLNATFSKELVSIVRKRPEEGDFALKFFGEIEDFNEKKGVIYNLREEKATLAEENRHMAKRVYKSKILKSKKSKNAFKKNKFFYI